ncbi:hypothetical protein ABH935_003598 [Catenulispora sp. GAS73]|uniref:hypothetical protein n=1 Tax=Catenulispora sp. GAS73 TaxID=3156269 RepID=UPI003516B6A4
MTDQSRDAALLLARIRATGDAPVPDQADVVTAAAVAADRIDRQLIRLVDTGRARRGDRLVLGWTDGAAPDPDRHPSAPPLRLAAVSYLTFALCLAAAWPTAEAAPYPGHGFRRSDILAAAIQMGANSKSVVAALDTTLPAAGLIAFHGEQGVLGPAAAALPQTTWGELRRIHEMLPHDKLAAVAPTTVPSPSPDQTSDKAGTRTISAPHSRPVTPLATSVSAIVAVLECAETVVDRKDLPQLADPAMRTAVSEALEGCGRTLVSVPDKGWTTGYAEGIADVLAQSGHGVLNPAERAVLTLILLRTVAIPRARGLQRGDSWAVSRTSTSLDELVKTRGLSRAAITDAIRELRRKGYVDSKPSGGYIPGPAFSRIDASLRAKLWEDLIVLARPNGFMAERIRARRTEQFTTGSDDSPRGFEESNL